MWVFICVRHVEYAFVWCDGSTGGGGWGRGEMSWGDSTLVLGFGHGGSVVGLGVVRMDMREGKAV